MRKVLVANKLTNGQVDVNKSRRRTTDGVIQTKKKVH